MALLPLDIPPGVVRPRTEYAMKGRWYDANHVRWSNGRLQPIGGWERVRNGSTGTPVRGATSWLPSSGERFVAFGSADGLYVHDNNILRDITPDTLEEGRVNSIYGLGWGAGLYGREAYGTARSTTGLVLDACTWSLDNFGDHLMACSTADGRLLRWVPGEVKAEPVPNAPENNVGLLVTNERFLVALGAGGDKRRIAWSDRENPEEWTPTATTEAGDLPLQSPGWIVGGMRHRGQNLIWTQTDVHTLNYVGPPYVYGLEQVGTGCGLIGPLAATGTQDLVVWMSDAGFWVFDGYVRPLPCDVHEYVFSDLNVLQGAKVAAGHNSEFNEIWFFYPSKSSVENDRYVVWNYLENWWTIGRLPRTTWVDRGVWQRPVAFAPDGHIYQHEQGYSDDGAFREVYAQTAALELGNGDRVMAVRQIIPDGCPAVASCVQVRFYLQQTPTGPTREAGPYQFTRADGYADARFTARQAKLRVENTRNSMFNLGVLRLDAVEGGRR